MPSVCTENRIKIDLNWVYTRSRYSVYVQTMLGRLCRVSAYYQSFAHTNQLKLSYLKLCTSTVSWNIYTYSVNVRVARFQTGLVLRRIQSHSFPYNNRQRPQTLWRIGSFCITIPYAYCCYNDNIVYMYIVYSISLHVCLNGKKCVILY